MCTTLAVRFCFWLVFWGNKTRDHTACPFSSVSFEPTFSFNKLIRNAVSMKLKNYRNIRDTVEGRHWNYCFHWLFTFVRLCRNSFFGKVVYFRGVACPVSFSFLISFSRNKALLWFGNKDTEIGPHLRYTLCRVHLS